MTIKEATKFYKNNEKKYIITNNKEFLSWLKDSIKQGYNAFLNIEDMQDMINNIANWYELKYPEREMEYYYGIRYEEFKDIENLSKKMNLKQLLYRLPENQMYLIEGGYRASGTGIRTIYNDEGKPSGSKGIIFMSIERKDRDRCREPKSFIITADYKTGDLEIDYNIKKITNNAKPIKIDDLYELIDAKYNDTLEYKDLKQCILNHNKDLELRDRLLSLTALKLLYSDNTVPERGYERAKRFINEFNKKLDLNLSTNEIDGLIDPDTPKELTPDKSKTIFDTIKDKLDRK